MKILMSAFLIAGIIGVNSDSKINQLNDIKPYGIVRIIDFNKNKNILNKKLTDELEEKSTTEEAVVVFQDSNFESAIRKAINKPNGDIYPDDMKNLTELSIHWENISSIEGIEYAINLTNLNLNYNNILDITPLQYLSNLTSLSINQNCITNITPLQNLNNLTSLSISYNYIDVSNTSPDRVIIDDLINKGASVYYNTQYKIVDNFGEKFTLKVGESSQLLVKRGYSSMSEVNNFDLEYTIENESVISIDSNNNLIGIDEGTSNVQVHYKNLRGGGATINHTITVDPYVYKPSIEYDINGLVTILDNGNNNLFDIKEILVETFENSSNLKFNFSNSNWTIDSGILKSETITHSESTENEFTINAIDNQKLAIKVRVSSENNCDCGRIYLNGVEVYNKSGNNTTFETIEFDLVEGENIVKFKYSKDSSGNSNEDAMIVDEIKTFIKKPLDTERIEYRLDGGEWMVYSGPFRINKPGGSDFKIEARAIVTPGIYESGITKITGQVISAEDLAEKLVEVAEQTKDYTDIELARDAVNNLDESSKKDELQDRLNSVFDTNITLEKQNVTVNLDVYIKSQNMLSLSLDTNSVSFEDYSGTEPVEKLGAVNITINSSLPYDLNAYMPVEISNTDGTNKMDLDILNIRESDEGIYKQFENTTDKIVLKENCASGNDINHSIDLKLDSNDAHVADVYKTVVRFEAEQK